MVAISPLLAEKWAALGSKPVVIPNGCQPTRGSVNTLPSAVRNLPAPVVGLVGQLSERIDLGILSRIVESGFSLLLVGPCDPRWAPAGFAALVGHPRVHYTGAVPAEAVPSYLATIDVGITPYQDSLFNRASFPLKTLEYLSAGRPVVTTDLPAARWLWDDLTCSNQAAFAEQILALSGTPAEFVTALRRVVGHPLGSGEIDQTRTRPRVAELCRAFAERHSWSARAKTFADLIGLTRGDEEIL